ARNVITTLDDGALVDIGVLVRTGVLSEVVDVHTHFAGDVFIVVDANHDTIGVNVIDDTATASLHSGARVDRNRAFDTGTNQRFFGAQARYGLALHVGAHQCTVGVVVLQEGNQRSSHRHD